MRHSLVARFILCSLLGGFLAQLHADPVTVRFKSMPMALGMGNLSFQAGGAYTQFPSDVFLPSKTTFTYSGENPMLLYQPGVVNGQQKMVPVGHVQFPSGRNFLVLLVQRGANAYGGVALPSDGPNFPPNSMRICNLTPLKLVAVCNDKSFNLSPGQSGIFTLGGDGQYNFSLSALRDGQMQQVSASADQIAPGSRHTLLILLANASQLMANPHVRPLIQVNDYADTTKDTGDSSEQN
jgi:hypothetical protein